MIAKLDRRLPALRLLPAAMEFPFVLTAGERRAYNATQIFRDPAWRKSDPDGALHIHPQGAGPLGLRDGALALCEPSRGKLEVRVFVTDAVRPGFGDNHAPTGARSHGRAFPAAFHALAARQAASRQKP